MAVHLSNAAPTAHEIERFWASVNVGAEEACWLWQRAIDPRGYGRFKLRSYVQVYAHRFSYEISHGPIPEGLTVDHLCNTRSCVNPSHLEVVTGPENSHRGAARRVLCANGLHDMRVPNAWATVNRRDGRATRYCRECRNATERRYWHRRKPHP